MGSAHEIAAAKNTLANNGYYGSMAITATDNDLIVTSVDMKNTTTYTIAAQPTVPSRLSFTVTATGTADTMGTLAVVGTDPLGNAQSETITPVAGSTVYTTKTYKTVTSVIGTGWAVDAVEGTKDKLIVGVAGIIAPAGFYIAGLQIVADTVVGSQTSQGGYNMAELSGFTKLSADVIYSTRLTAVELTSGEAIGYLSPL